MIRELGETIENAVFENVGRASARVQERKPLPADLLESDDAYLVVFDAPGATASDVQVRYVDDRVEVRIDRFREFHDGFDMLFPGRGLSLDGSLTLPEDAAVDADAATATLKADGTLQVTVPKVETVDADGDEHEDTHAEADAADHDEDDGDVDDSDA
ncbi:Hsp20/alpha crystallin family protein [Halomicroarcula sp. GCM10025709]|uniref:Hsp20/alpha crystallin family protein n=1 Tax=Haloarcula TaxID=2237 RepID=UPI0024C293B1|nr:Hsp20/alpha crystallin family protein [Halomicroarcula sp. YJ-61-S]